MDIQAPDEEGQLEAKAQDSDDSILRDLGLDDASCAVLQEITGELIDLTDTRVASCLDPRIGNDSNPDAYESLGRIARLFAENGPALEPTKEPGQTSVALSGLLNPEKRKLLIDAFNYLDFVIGSCEGTARELCYPTEDDFVLTDQARSLVLLLVAQGVRAAREIHWLLMGGFPDAAWARWRTLHELAVTAAFIVDKEDPDMPSRYLARSHALKRQLTKVMRDHGLLTDAEGDDDESVTLAEALDKNNYSWASEKTGKKHGDGFTGLERKAGLDSFRPFYTIANSTIHADAVSLYNTYSSNGPLVTGAKSSDFYLPVHLTLQSLRILTSSMLFASARYDDSDRVVNLTDYFSAVICTTEFVDQCEKKFGRYDDAHKA